MELAPELLARHTAVLRDYLKGGGEAALKCAHELGSDALAAGASPVEFARAQLEALVTILRDVPGLEEGAQLAGRAVDVFVRSLSPFEIAHRWFQEAWTTMRESEQRHRTLIEIVPDVVFTLSPDGVVTQSTRSPTQVRRRSDRDRHGLQHHAQFHDGSQCLFWRSPGNRGRARARAESAGCQDQILGSSAGVLNAGNSGGNSTGFWCSPAKTLRITSSLDNTGVTAPISLK